MADWKDYNIQDLPATETATNIVTAEYLNGMSGAIKKLMVEKLFVFEGKLPSVINVDEIRVLPSNLKNGLIVSFSIKQANGTWATVPPMDGNRGRIYIAHSDGNIRARAVDSAYINADFKATILAP